jgi:hypothetical protein
MGVKPFAAGNTLESLRDSDFDSCSAYGEVVDNSIQADAENIRILFEPKGKDHISRVIFMDDGKGMPPEILQNCLRLGWSSRYNDRAGIGRFGVGMTLGAIHECRRVEVYSKPEGGEWHYTYLDLDEIENTDTTGKEWEIPSPIKKSPADIVSAAYVPGVKGTIVIWSKYDRAQDKYKKIIDEFRVWVGRTFRYYMWNEAVDRKFPVTIYLNGTQVSAIDPLYVRPEKTAFPDDPPAKEFEPIEFDWPINDPKVVEQIGKDSAKIKIRLSLLPEKLREYQGVGGADETSKRHIDMNEGFSFLRKGREVGYDWIPRFAFAVDAKDRWWGCEIHFDPVLDRAFTVKNIKRGAVPSVELKKAINDKIGPWIKSQRDTVSLYWKQNNSKQEKSEIDLPKGASSHLQSEKIAGKAQVPASKLGLGKDLNVETKKLAELVSDGNTEEAARWEARFKSQPFTVAEKGWLGSTFVDIHYMGGKDALFYNNRHKFFEVLSLIKAEIKDGINVEYNATRLEILIDVLLIAYAKAEASLNPNDEIKAVDFIGILKDNWGQYLKTYITTWQSEYDETIIK